MNKNKEENICKYYLKNGACRYGYLCQNSHKEPSSSRTLLFAHFFENSPVSIALAGGQHVPDHKISEVIEELEQFYIEVFLEVAKFGEIEEMYIVDNIGDHLLVKKILKKQNKVYKEEDIEDTQQSLNLVQ